MAFQTVFKRYELKYILTHDQKEAIREAMKPYMAIDQYGRTTIRNIYCDTGNFRLVRTSIEKPIYKEKLRLRSYRQVGPDDTVFVELKKKYNHIVYKRRIALGEKEAMDWVFGDGRPSIENQITDEIDYFLSFYGDINPAMFLSYEREAYYAKDGSDFRVTFDENILHRDYDLSLESEAYGTEVLSPEKTLMEIKCAGAMPLWLAHALTSEHIHRGSFSKYGEAYQNDILPELIREVI